jgi:hypothetical protein
MMLLFFILAAWCASARRVVLSNVTLEYDGVYWAQLDVGTPPQSFSVILDTGSDVAAIPCVTCPPSGCGKKHRRWNYTESSTASYDTTYVRETNSSVLVTRYSEGSFLNMTVLEDAVCLDTVCISRYMIGCIHDQSKMFRMQEADGIFGLSGSFLDAVGAFSMCYKDRTFDVGLPYHGSKYTWLQLLRPARLEDDTIRSFKLDLQAVGGINARGSHVIIDSGSTDVILPREYRTRALMGLCSVHFTGMAAPIVFTPCISPSEITEGDMFVFGASFFRRIPRIVFTRTHVGLRLDEDVPSCDPDVAPVPRRDPWPPLALMSSYIFATLVCVRTFLF